MTARRVQLSDGDRKRLLVQFIKYGISGGIATGVHLAAFYALSIWVLPALTADDPVFRILPVSVAPKAEFDPGLRAVAAGWNNGVAFLVSNFAAYMLNILFVFKPGRHHWLVEIGLFYLVSFVSWLIGTGIQSWLIVSTGLATTFAFGANMLASLSINYAMRKFVIFKS